MLSKANSAQLRQAAPVFAALGDDVRLSLVTRLARGESLSITRLTSGLPITRQAVTKHLRVLEEAGLVSGARQGREQVWALKPEGLREAQRYLDIIDRQWSEALGRLKQFVEKE